MTCCYIPNWKRKEWKPKPKYRIYENKHGKFYIKTRGFFGWKVLRQTEVEYDILSRPGIIWELFYLKLAGLKML